MRRLFATALVFCLAAAIPACAQEPAANQADINQKLLQRLQELEREVQSLRAQTQAPAVTSVPEPMPVSEPAAVNEVAPRLKLNYLGDMGYHVGHYYGPTNSFEIGRFDMFATARLSNRLSVLGEVLFEGLSDNSIAVDIERLLLKYRQSDYLTASIGRIHTAIGYYNTAFHRGEFFQTAIGRPAMFEFDDQGGFLPMQDVGISLEGKIPSGKLGLNYVFEVTNGRFYGQNQEPTQNTTDANNSKAVNINISAKPEKIAGLDVGFSFRHDYLSDVNNLQVAESIPVIYVVFTNSKYEFLNEGMVVSHSEPVGPVHHTTGFYSQISRAFGRYRPYFRYSYVNAPNSDPIYGNDAEIAEVGRINGPALGMRADFNSHAAFKLQYEREGKAAEKSTNGAAVQFAFTF
jgi:hypothetical protein